jgi:SAM-dependent methyltransferase
MDQRSEFNRIYGEILDVSPLEYYSQIKSRILHTWNRISPLIRPSSDVVEIGIGPICVLAKELKNAKVIGVDLNNSHMDLCQRFGIDLRVCNLETTLLPLEDESADIVLLLETVEHLCMYPNDLFGNIFKKLRKGGLLVVSTVNFLRLSNRIRVIFGKNPLTSYFERTEIGENHIREFLSEEMSYYFKKSGFTINAKCMLGIPQGKSFLSKAMESLVYVYPNFRNYFLLIGKK